MKKEDLKNGMFVELNDGNRWFVFKNELIDVLVSPIETTLGVVTINIEDITDNLEIKFEGFERTFTIDRIFFPDSKDAAKGCVDVLVRQVMRCKVNVEPIWTRQ